MFASPALIRHFLISKVSTSAGIALRGWNYSQANENPINVCVRACVSAQFFFHAKESPAALLPAHSVVIRFTVAAKKTHTWLILRSD